MDPTTWPISIGDVLAARDRIRPYIPPTPLRSYAPLDAAAGARVLVKHENHNPTNSFKARNAMSVMTALSDEERRHGVIAATRGNHGAGLAWAGQLLGAPVTICVPRGNNPEKNEAMRGFGAELIEDGADYDEAVAVAEQLVQERGLTLVHSTNDPRVVAGAATVALEILEQCDGRLDAMVVGVGGGSQAVGALSVMRARAPGVKVYGVQAERASAIRDSWVARKPMPKSSANTFADGLATRNVYRLTFPALCEGLAGFETVTEEEIAFALRLTIRTTHNLVEGAAAAAVAGLLKLRDELAGKTVAVVLSGSNIDEATLRKVMNGEIS